jgi:hypothetical protein
MSIMDKIFGAKPVAAPATPAPQAQVQPGNIPETNINPAMAGNPTVPAESMNPADPANPLDQFKDMFAVDPNAKPVEKEKLFNVDPAKLQQAAKGNDFTKVISPEMMQAIAAGGEGAVAATLAAMNAMSQKSFADSALATTKIVEQALEKQQKAFEKQLPSLIKNQNLSENLRNSSPIFNHPAAAPILDMFKNQVAQKYPNATAAEQQKMAQEYVQAFAEAANPAKPTPQQAAAASETNWDDFLS